MDIQSIVANLVTACHQREQAVIQECLQRLERGKGGTLTIRSEADFGQDLLVRTVLSQCSLPCYYGKCQPSPFGSPYGAFRQCFPDCFDSFRSLSRAQYAETLADFQGPMYQGKFRGTLSRMLTSQKTRPIELDDRIGIPLAEFLGSQPHPFVLFLEDVHWADLSTLKMIHYISKALSQKSVLLILCASPEVLDTPELPPELRGNNVPVIQQIKAMQLMSRPKIAGKGQKKILEELFSSPVIHFEPLSDSLLVSILDKMIRTELSSRFKKRIISLAQGNLLFLSQIFLFMSENLLEPRGKKFELKYAEKDIQFPVYLEGIFDGNLSRLGEAEMEALQYAALCGSHLPVFSWRKILGKEEPAFEQILCNCLKRGVVQQYKNDEIVFSSEKYRQAILNNLLAAERKIIHSKWASFLMEQGILDAPVPHLKGAQKKQEVLEYSLHAGTYAEDVQAYPEAYEYYQDAVRMFPEIRKEFETFLAALIEISRPKEEATTPLQKAKRFSQALLQKIKEPDDARKKMIWDLFVQSFPRYRMAALDDPSPLLTDDVKSLLQSMCSWYPVSQLFEVVAPLLLYLIKVARLDPKLYPKEERAFLFDLVTQKIIPARDWDAKIAFWREALAIDHASHSFMMLSEMFEKKGDASKKEPQLAAWHYLSAAFYARKADDLFHCARILHKNIQFCQKHFEIKSVPWSQIESLRQLGMAYEKRAQKEELQEEERLNYAVQATSAYRDTVNRLWQSRDSGWLAHLLMEKTFRICEEHYLENDIVLELLNNARVKLEMKGEEEYHGKALLIVEEEDLGAAELLQWHLREEGVSPDIQIGGELPVECGEYKCAIVVATPYSMKDLRENLYASSLLGVRNELSRKTGWFCHESRDFPCFLISGNDPAEAYRMTWEFCENRTVRSYI